MIRFTRKNPSAHPNHKPTYGIPIERAGEFSVKTFGRFTTISGDIVNKLGKYEDIGEPEEILCIPGIEENIRKRRNQ